MDTQRLSQSLSLKLASRYGPCLINKNAMLYQHDQVPPGFSFVLPPVIFDAAPHIDQMLPEPCPSPTKHPMLTVPGLRYHQGVSTQLQRCETASVTGPQSIRGPVFTSLYRGDMYLRSTLSSTI